MNKVTRGIEKAVSQLSPQSFSQAAEAILTTDRFSKTAMASCRVGGKDVVVAGMAKGAGMIAPNMATMLAYILTDAAVSISSLKGILSRTADKTFNSVTVDGGMSTNDTLLFLANGHAGNRTVQRSSPDERKLEHVVLKVMHKLAVKLVEDAEGGTKIVEILVQSACSVADAKRVAFAVANSNLVKTAFFGEDPNLGRIMAGIGSSGVAVNPSRVDVSLGKVKVVSKGVALGKGLRQAGHVLRHKSFQVRIDLRMGHRSASVWTSDLTFNYVRINSAYHT
jgi:glutamate N-acetyltransferase/amino-acid N-acetyltransferase